MQKLLLLTLIFSFAFSSVAQEANWLTDFEKAKTIAKEEDKLILISFSGSDWCVPCARLERDLFSTEAFIDFTSENLVLVKADFPVRKKNLLSEEQQLHNEALAAEYNKDGSFPKVLIVDKNGTIKGFLSQSLSNTDAYIVALKNLLI